MKELDMILSLVATSLGLLITALTLLVKIFKNAKAKKISEQIIKIGNAILPYIKEAEKFVSYTGEEKKAYVMTKANQFAIENGLTFDQSMASNKIEELVALTKQVNVKSKPNEKEKQTKLVTQTTESKSWL